MTSSALGFPAKGPSKRTAASKIALPKSFGTALTFIYLAAIWAVFVGVLLKIPHPGAELLQLAGL